MKRSIWILLLVGLVAASAACTADQTTEDSTTTTSDETTLNTEDLTAELTSEFVAEGGDFQLNYPSAWLIEETFPGASVLLANTSEALERHRSGVAPQPGDLMVTVGLVPYPLMRQREVVPLGIQFDAGADVFLASALPMFQLDEGASLGDVVLQELDGSREAGRATVGSDDSEGLILWVPTSGEAAALVSTVAALGDSARFEEVVLAITSSIRFDGDGDALYGGLLSR
ncbi:MAG TPA: hypothetical protein VEB69_12115 [Acidimicrobiia bacterium]|nr:hypothetical protein [Acidimicrobiia bacterium]